MVAFLCQCPYLNQISPLCCKAPGDLHEHLAVLVEVSVVLQQARSQDLAPFDAI